MERSRKQKLLMTFVLVISIASLSVGFAAFSASLNISSNASVSANSDTFVVKFSSSKDSLVVSEIAPSDISDGITASNAIIDNSTSLLITNLTVSFTEPGQFVEYVFYARNEGEYTAYLNSINLSGEKSCTGTSSANVQSACDSISMKVMVGENEYTETTEISGHSLAKKSGEEIRVRIDYASTGGWADATFKVSFPNIMMVYSTINDSSYVPTVGVMSGNPLLIDVIKKNAILDDKVDFSKTVDSGTFIRNGTQNDEYPIYYFRGTNTKSIVKFANYCWEMIRSTDTGGVKLLFYGNVASDGTCSTRSVAFGAPYSAYSLDDTSYADVGYMYGERVKPMSTTAYDGVVMNYGKSISWDGKNYYLEDVKKMSVNGIYSFDTDYNYTCFGSLSCNEVYFRLDFGLEGYMFYSLKGGETITDILNKMFKNDNDSNIKTLIDEWYVNNLISYADYLEDTIWCNDRGMSNYVSDTGVRRFRYVFDSSMRVFQFEPSLECDINDSFTVENPKGNMALTYPVALLSVDEMLLNVGKSVNSASLASLSPGTWTNDGALSFANIFYGPRSFSLYSAAAIKPAISIKNGTRITGGEGTTSNPYTIE